MKQFLTVFKFEFSKYAKGKAFIALTVIGVLLIAGFLTYPTIVNSFTSQDDEGQQEEGTYDTIGVINNSAYDTEHTLDLFQATLSYYNYEVLDKTTNDEAKSLVENGSYKYVIVLDDESNYTLIAGSIGFYDTISQTVDGLMQKQYKAFLLEKQGLDYETSSEIMNASVNQTIIETGKNQFNSFFYTYVIVFLLYMSIMIYGQMIATNVASEKSSRAMETLVTTVSPTRMMFGKVLGIGSVALLQIVLLIGSGMLFYKINIAAWGDNQIVRSLFDIPLDMVVISVLIFILGFFLYAFIYAVIGSFAKRLEDVNSSVMPLTLLSIASFFVVIFSMSSGNMNSTLIKVCTYIPFTSPLALPARFAMSAMHPVELIISILVLLLSTIGIGYLASGVYRLGVLLYGKRPGVKEIYKQLKSDRQQ